MTHVVVTSCRSR